MKIIVTGSHDFKNESILSEVLRDYTRNNQVSKIALGQQQGAETMTAEWAMKNDIQLAIVPTNSSSKDEEAYIKRNAKLIETHKDAVAILHFVGSKVSEDLCRRSFEYDIPVDDVFVG